MVRQRSRTGQGKTKRSVIRKDSSGSISEQLPNRDDGMVLILFNSLFLLSLWKRTVLNNAAVTTLLLVTDHGLSACGVHTYNTEMRFHKEEDLNPTEYIPLRFFLKQVSFCLR